MKYEVGEKVKIKKDKDYTTFIQERLQKANHVVTVEKVGSIYYLFEETHCCYWEESYIEGYPPNCKEFFEPITIRFELMEL